MSLTYQNGRFQFAATRGDGVVGEDVSHNVRTIRSLPMEIDFLQELEVRGEVYMPKASFAALNEKRREKGEEEFANPRNAAAGSIRQLDSRIAASRGLDALWYHVPQGLQLGHRQHWQSLQFLQQLGFRVNPLNRLCSSMTEVWQWIEELARMRPQLPYEIDGRGHQGQRLSAAAAAGLYRPHPALGDCVQISGRTGRYPAGKHLRHRWTNGQDYAERPADAGTPGRNPGRPLRSCMMRT